MLNFNILDRLCSWASWIESNMVGKPHNRFPTSRSKFFFQYIVYAYLRQQLITALFESVCLCVCVCGGGGGVGGGGYKDLHLFQRWGIQVWYHDRWCEFCCCLCLGTVYFLSHLWSLMSRLQSRNHRKSKFVRKYHCKELNSGKFHVRIQVGGTGALKNHRNIGFFSNTGLDPLKITKLPSQHSMLGHYRHASETPFQWHFAGRPMMAQLKRF